MKKRVILSVVILAVVIVGSTLLYNNLIDKVESPDMLGGQGGSPSAEGATPETLQIETGSTDTESAAPETPSTEAPSTEIGSATPEDEAASPDAQSDEQIKAPNFTVQDATGNPVKLSDLQGKPVVLNFWASWCPPCKSEMPEFNKVFEELGDEVQFMMIDAVDGSRETKDTGTAYIAEEGYTFPVYFDMEQDAVIGYGIRAFPTSIFIDSEGYIAAGVEGAIDEATLRRGVEMIK